MKKILIFSLNYYPKFIGGAEVAIKEITSRISGQDSSKYEFHMLTLRFDSDLPRYEIIHGIHVHRIGFTLPGATISDLRKFPLFLNKYYFQVFAPLYAWKLHKKENFDATWAMMAHAAGVPAGIFKTFFPNVKYILTLQEGDPPGHVEKMAKPFFPPISTISFWFFKRGFKKADIVQSISTFLDIWSVRMGNKNFRTVIPNGVDVKQFTRHIGNEEIQIIKNKIGKNHGEIWLATTSRLVPKNAVDDCIQALVHLPAKCKFLIMGIGPQEAELKNLVKKLNLEHRVVFAGEIKHPEIAVYLKACDIFIRPSRSEGMGNSFVEAMALKMPVIATTEGGLSDLIFDGQTAFVVQKNNSDSIKEAVLRIENLSSEERQIIIDTAYNMVIDRFDWNLIAERMDKEIFSKI